MNLTAHVEISRLARAFGLGMRCAVGSGMNQTARRPAIPADHHHEPLFRKTTHRDNYGVRVVETCACGANRVIEHWSAEYRTPATPRMVAALARDGVTLAEDGSETTKWFRLGDPA
jgi:hypothetical protein